MVTEGHWTSFGAGDSCFTATSSIKLLSRNKNGVSPPAFGDANKLLDKEANLRFKSAKPLVINEGGYQAPKIISECVGKGKGRTEAREAGAERGSHGADAGAGMAEPRGSGGGCRSGWLLKRGG
ncbi:hypothetical protein MA16_Dca025562 [Dendrobium catenatum]|uniref:Uncharacterized protein n=1 Tax=Dendrobium catenatum TaxID=906689 RepID=A0A2I0WDL7_9ASPA|nr:hypothetical protein MA16_Dca025562 [Dendrobium catenatum]